MTPDPDAAGPASDAAGRAADGGPARPALRVVSGDASPEELAALLAVISARSGDAPRRPAPAPSGWNDRARGLRRPLPHGPGAWTASGRP